jgi:hypothetical protein
MLTNPERNVMENETVEVLEPEIVSDDDSDTGSKLANIAVAGAALVGVASGARFLVRKLPWSVTIARKTKETEVPEPAPVEETPAVAE